MSVYPTELFEVRRWCADQARRLDDPHVGELMFRVGLPPTVDEVRILSVHSFHPVGSDGDASATVIATSGPTDRAPFCTHRLTRGPGPDRWELSDTRGFPTLARAVDDAVTRDPEIHRGGVRP